MLLSLYSFLSGVLLADAFRHVVVLAVFPVFFVLPLFPFLKEKFSWKNALSVGFSFALGTFFLFFRLPEIAENHIGFFATTEGTPLSVHSVVDSYPQKNFDGTQEMVLRPHQIEMKNGEMHQIEHGKILLRTHEKTEFSYGDHLSVRGKFSLPEKFEDFDYPRFLQKDDIFVLVKSPQLEKTSAAEKWNEKFWSVIFEARKWFEGEILKKLPSPQAEYAIGILLGAEEGIPPEVIAEFNTTGLRHLLALSGFNITILLVAFFWVFAWLPKIPRVVLTVFGIFLFVMLTGASSSVVRAGIMGSLGMIALQSGKTASLWRLLAYALLGMTLWNPFLLFSDVSLQFSVFAVVGIAVLQKPLGKFFEKIQYLPSFAKEAMMVTIASQIFTLPLSIMYFQTFSLIAPIANVLVAPLTAFAMLVSFGTVFPVVGWIFLPFAYIVLSFSLLVASALSKIPYASISW